MSETKHTPGLIAAAPEQAARIADLEAEVKRLREELDGADEGRAVETGLRYQHAKVMGERDYFQRQLAAIAKAKGETA